MSAALLHDVGSQAGGWPARFRRKRAVANAPLMLRHVTRNDAGTIHSLVLEHLTDGNLLPREQTEIEDHAQIRDTSVPLAALHG